MRVDSVPVATETRAPTGETNAYVLGEDPAVLVDPADRTDALDETLADRRLEHVLVTHTHPDHVGGVAAYAEDATVWCKRGREDRFRDATGVGPDRTVHEGSTVPVDGGELLVWDLPGHAPDHLGFVVPCGVVVGDIAVAEGSVVVGAPEGDMRGYMVALRRLWALDPDRLFPGHGPVIDDPRATLERLIEHRRDRERRVAAAVRDGADTVEAVLEAAYDKDLTGVRDLAAATVRTHLEKLAVEGRVAFDGDRVRPV